MTTELGFPTGTVELTCGQQVHSSVGEKWGGSWKLTPELKNKAFYDFKIVNLSAGSRISLEKIYFKPLALVSVLIKAFSSDGKILVS